MTFYISLGSTNSSSQLHPPLNTPPARNRTMASSRLVARSSRALAILQRPACRSFSISAARSNEFEALNKRTNDTSEAYRKYQKEKPLNPHLTNTTSTIENAMPSVGANTPPPELISNVDPKFTPTDSVPENTQKMTGGTQSGAGGAGGEVSGNHPELGVGEMEGAKFKVEPLRRTGEDANTMRARLLCPFLAPAMLHACASSLKC